MSGLSSVSAANAPGYPNNQELALGFMDIQFIRNRILSRCYAIFDVEGRLKKFAAAKLSRRRWRSLHNGSQSGWFHFTLRGSILRPCSKVTPVSCLLGAERLCLAAT